jgi:hypothetical protein
MLFDCGDADFKLKSFVDFVLFELGQLGVETIYLPSEIGLDAVDLCVELVDAPPDLNLAQRHMRNCNNVLTSETPEPTEKALP